MVPGDTGVVDADAVEEIDASELAKEEKHFYYHDEIEKYGIIFTTSITEKKALWNKICTLYSQCI